ncbi:11076_t:CDS:2, partial [Acaulospora colombiana]
NRNILSNFTIPTYQCLQKRTFFETPITKLQPNLFDTSQFVQKLESEGFTRQQSEAIMNSLSEVISESMQYLTRNMVTKADQEREMYESKVDFAQLKSEIQMLEKNDFSLLKSDNERLVAEVEKLKQRLSEEIKRTQAATRLDMNLEKGRIRDESSMLEMKLKETDTRIESEISNLRTQMEAIKFQAH